jgi:hypothetical protein
MFLLRVNFYFSHLVNAAVKYQLKRLVELYRSLKLGNAFFFSYKKKGNKTNFFFFPLVSAILPTELACLQ